MNRSVQESDVFERVLYEFLLTTDAHTRVDQVAAVLKQEFDLVCAVASIALRLGFAHKHHETVRLYIYICVCVCVCVLSFRSV